MHNGGNVWGLKRHGSGEKNCESCSQQINEDWMSSSTVFKLVELISYIDEGLYIKLYETRIHRNKMYLYDYVFFMI